jgi:iron complex outermembrane receptor protein
MRRTTVTAKTIVTRSASALALATAFLATPALAQVAGPDATNSSPEQEAGAGESGGESEIVVTGSRIARAGFDQPTPTTVIGDVELRQGARESLQQALNEQPQLRNTTSSSSTIANTASGVAPVDLRGLGSVRTLTLVNGRRFVGDNNLNFVPTNLVERVEIVTGGASAAWGSGAVAGVVNIILNDKLEGLSVAAQTGVSSRGDGFRYGFDGSFGTSFAGGAGRFIIGAEYVNDERIGPEGMKDRPWYGADFVAVPGGRRITPNVSTNLVVAGAPVTFGGTILTGPLAGRVFNPDGSVRPSTSADAINVFETLAVRSPLERVAGYARATYDFGDATVWADLSYGRSYVDQPFLPDTASGSLAFAISASNPFLAPSVRAQLAPGSSFLVGRLSADTAFLQFEATRETVEGAIGVNGAVGAWKYRAHYSHGEIDSRQTVGNSFISGGAAGGRFARAINAVQTPGGIVCAVNADASPANDDPACVAFNPFGVGAASQAARNYVTGTQRLDGTTKLDVVAAEIQGDPFSLWAGPVTVVVGVEARREEQTNVNGEQDRQTALDAFRNPVSTFGTPLFFSPVSGSVTVKEAFGETLIPLSDAEGFKVELNGAARYSDYARSGGIWSWKVGGTAHLFDTLLLRGTRSRDIRAPNVTELFQQNTLNIRQVNDRDTSRCVVANGCNARPTITLLTSGNQDLVPEVSKAWTAGGSISPAFFPGFNLSVDYYDIEIEGAIQAPDTADITVACLQGDTASCALVDRSANGTITTVRAINANIASFQTNGVDIEASYLLRVPGLGGTVRLRGLASYVDKLLFQTPACIATNTCRETAGSVGDTVVNGVPHWRGNLSATYQGDALGLDLRVRYVGGGKFDKLDTTIVNNEIKSRTYVDAGAQFKVGDQFTLFTNVRNVFDRKPPLSIQLGGIHYDTIGRYFTAGARVKF